ncbi:MAG TPA: DUF6166 domain-containing protein [Kiloniellales bacterium]|nr:DUF6166 domain-containing protein [Kiloniellales bacterium]
MKAFRGDRTIDGIVVTVDGRRLDPRFDLASFTKNSYEWGYEGAEPTQLAFAILNEHLGDAERAKALAAPFMREVVANFGNEWELSGAEIDRVLQALAGKAATKP